MNLCISEYFIQFLFLGDWDTLCQRLLGGDGGLKLAIGSVQRTCVALVVFSEDLVYKVFAGDLS